jgi:hypothetical protein
VALPSKQNQILAIAKFLDSDHTEGRELSEIAEDIVDAFHGLLKSQIKRPVLTPHVGMAFKHPSLSGVWYVAYDTGSFLWLVCASSSYGGLIPSGAPFWGDAEESTDNRKPKKNEAGEEIPLSPRPGSPGHNPDWVVGDKVSTGQRAHVYDVVATGDKCVLLLSDGGVIHAESNSNMKRFYHKEDTSGLW